MQQHSRPLWLAALASPWLATLGFCLYFALLVSADTAALDQWAEVMRAAFTRVLPGTYAAACVLLLPYAHWLRTRAMLSVPSVCAGTVMAGLVAAVSYGYVTLGWGSSPEPLALRLGVGLGLLLGLGFCLVAGVSPRRRTHAR